MQICAEYQGVSKDLSCMGWNGVGVLTEIQGIMNADQYCDVLEGGVVESFEKLEMPEGERMF